MGSKKQKAQIEMVKFLSFRDHCPLEGIQTQESQYFLEKQNKKWHKWTRFQMDIYSAPLNSHIGKKM